MAPSNTHQQQQLLEMADSIPMTYGDDIFMVTSHAQNHFSHPIYEFDTVQPLQPVEPQFTEYNATPDSFSSSDLSTLPCLDYEILNGDSGLEDWVGADFQLFPTDLGYESYPGSLFLDNQGIDLSSSDDEANPKTKAARPTPPESACTVYNCSHCPRVFQKRHELNRHLLKHNRPFSCTVLDCGQSFAEKRGLDRHIQSRHARINKIQCRYCNYSSTRSDAVQRHLKTKHGVKVSFHGGMSTATISQIQG